MAYSYLARAELGPAKAGLTASVYYRVVDLAGTQVIGATNSGVTASTVPGNYHVAGGLSLADEFAGRILWSADSGSTWLAEEAVDLRLASSVWGHSPRTLTQSAVTVASAVAGDALSLLRGDTLSAQFAGIGSLVGRAKLWLTIKACSEDADADALVQVEELLGLLRLNGTAATGSDGALTVTDASVGDVTLTLAAAATAALAPGRYHYDLQVLISDAVVTRIAGIALVHADVTRATG